MTPLEETRLLRNVQAIADKLDAIPRLPADATAACFARQAAHVRGFFWVDEFAATIGASVATVRTMISRKTLHVLPHRGKTYRIPLSEETRFNTLP